MCWVATLPGLLKSEWGTHKVGEVPALPSCTASPLPANLVCGWRSFIGTVVLSVHRTKRAWFSGPPTQENVSYWRACAVMRDLSFVWLQGWVTQCLFNVISTSISFSYWQFCFSLRQHEAIDLQNKYSSKWKLYSLYRLSYLLCFFCKPYWNQIFRPNYVSKKLCFRAKVLPVVLSMD